jgi:hypothetical protein
MAWKPNYVTVEQAKEYLRIPETDTADDVRLGLDVAAASRAIDRATNRQFGKLEAAAVRYYTAQYDCDRGWFISIDDLQDLTGVEVTSSGATITDYRLAPLNAASEGRPYTELVFGSTVKPDTTYGGVGVLAPFGWTTVPDTIKDASLLQTARFFKRSDAPFGVAGSPESGSEMRLLAKVDPDVAVMVADYVRRWWSA